MKVQLSFFKRRRRAMNTSGIVLWSILMGAAITFVNGLGLAGTAILNPNAPGAGQLQPNLAPCGQSASGLPLNCTTTAPPDILTAGFYSLGYFFNAFTQAIPIMVQGVGVPGTLASIYFGSGIGVAVNAGMFFLIAIFAWAFVANRPQLEPQ